MKFMLTKEQNKKFKEIFSDLKALAADACAEGDMPYLIVAFGSATEVDSEFIVDNDLYFGFNNANREVMESVCESISDEADRFIETSDEVDDMLNSLDASDISSWINIDKDRLN